MLVKEINAIFPDFWAGTQLSFKYHSYERTHENWSQEPILQPFSRLNFVVDGSCVFYSDNQRIEMEPGNVYLIPGAIPNGYYGTDSVELINFEFFLTMPDGLDYFSSCKRYLSYKIPMGKIKQIISCYTSNDATDMLYLKSVVWESISKFAQMLTEDEKRRVIYSNTVQKAIVYIRKNLSSSLTVKEVSDGIFASYSALNNKFRKELGLSVSEYIEHLVMKEAQRKLLTSDVPIGRISAMLGFCDQFYFSRRFKKLFGMTPQEFRRINKKCEGLG